MYVCDKKCHHTYVLVADMYISYVTYDSKRIFEMITMAPTIDIVVPYGRHYTLNAMDAIALWYM